MIDENRSDKSCGYAPAIARSRDAMVADVRRRLSRDFHGLAGRSLESCGTTIADAVAQCDRLVDELLRAAPAVRTARAHGEPTAQALTAPDERDAGPVPRLLVAFTVQV